MRISAFALILLFPLVSEASLCGMFKVEGYVRQGVDDELVLNPEAVTRMPVKITNKQELKKYQGRVIKAELILRSECSLNCVGTIYKINGTVSPYEKVETFSRAREVLVSEQPCSK